MEAKAKTPKRGWAVEVKEAKSAMEREPNNGDNIMRLAQAYQKMRQWEDLEDHISTSLLSTLSLDGHGGGEGTRTQTQTQTESETKTEADTHTNTNTALLNSECRGQLNAWLKEAKDYLSQETSFDRPGVEIFRKKTLRKMDLENRLVGHPQYPNLNIVQYAAVTGDIRLLEKAISFGAAIDFPVEESYPVPAGATPLLLCCASLAVHSIFLRQHDLGRNPQAEMELRGCLECAKQLVRLGADCDAKLLLPPFSGNDGNSEIFLYRHCGLDNKSAHDLARMSGKQKLIQLMDKYKIQENAVKSVHCRCGSRLAWKKCHAASGKEPHCIKDQQSGSSRLYWRLSPHANCNCGHTDKSYYRCCWKYGKATYQNDTNGKLHSAPAILIANDENKGFSDSLNYLQSLPEEQQRRLDENMRNSDLRDMFLTMTDKTWREVNDVNDPDGISKVRAMDFKIYGGIMKQMHKEQWFQWTDLHWFIPKAELLKRTEEWNTALEQYCDSKGLTGAKRQEVIDIHQASSLAPCADPECNNVEKEPKEFNNCAQCKRVSYCSKDCQRNHWKKKHKKRCVHVKKGLPPMFNPTYG